MLHFPKRHPFKKTHTLYSTPFAKKKLNSVFWMVALINCVYCLTPSELQNELNSAISNPSINSWKLWLSFHQSILIQNANNFTVHSSSDTIIFINCSYKEVQSITSIPPSIISQLIVSHHASRKERLIKSVPVIQLQL